MSIIISHNKKLFLQIVRLGISADNNVSFPDPINWEAIETLAARQGLSAIVLDGIEKLKENKRPPKKVLLQWIGSTLQEYENRYVLYRKAIVDLARFYNVHGNKMMVIKGLACSIDWPIPEHRPCGDIDIWQFGHQKEADEILTKKKNIVIDNTHHHHTVFTWKSFTVENHFDFLNVHHHKSNVELEAILKELGQDDSHYVEMNGERVYLPSPNLHALFLLRHTMSNFAAAGMTLRQLLDWAFFVEKHTKEVDWKWLLEVLDKYGMLPLFNIYNAICVEDLGFDANIFPSVQFDPIMKERVLKDILSPEFSEVEMGNFCCRAIYKYRRWRANAWKHELCFSESMWSSFWSGVWSHLLKPASI